MQMARFIEAEFWYDLARGDSAFRRWARAPLR